MSYKFELRGVKSPENESTFGDMKTGDIAVITDSMYKGEIVMQFGSSTRVVASLSNPINWWDSAASIKVRILTRDEVAKLFVV